MALTESQVVLLLPRSWFKILGQIYFEDFLVMFSSLPLLVRRVAGSELNDRIFDITKYGLTTSVFSCRLHCKLVVNLENFVMMLVIYCFSGGTAII